MNEITLLQPNDMHVHFRDGNIMRAVVPLHTNIFARCLVMPNVPKIYDALDAYGYYYNLKSISPTTDFIMTIMLSDNTTPDIIENLTEYEWIKACKLYPKGVTTGSHDGVSNVKLLAKVFESMEKNNLLLLIHAEHPDRPILDREEAYLPEVDWIVKNFPNLKIVIEHISTRAAYNYVVHSNNNVSATITAHHLLLTIDDLLSNGLKPHNYCNPILKSSDDREALLHAAITNPKNKFFFGSDTAPHPKHNKESACCSAGIFVPAEIAMNILINVFSDNLIGRFSNKNLKKLEQFTSINGARFYGYPIAANNTKKITFVKEPWTVPDNYGGLVPFMAGKTLDWKLK